LFRSAPSAENATAESMWADLLAGDAVRAYRAVWRLTALSEADGFLARQLQPVETIPSERLHALVADLGSPKFDTRERAERALASAGEAAGAAFADAEKKDAETRRRLAVLQSRLEPRAPDRLREARALLVLEARGTAEARR